ncbi:MAG: bifunctional hydroxymethylpyrimidine kinase/phosphomethylpyrimidine kinase [Aquificae bacterium]|nr:bifunctional hydroxymethylpyrimidine kinase/phosphomethylpyrimidine kinase [Aquificota bacterium]
MKNISLTIAGSDPSGGAGLQVDLKVFKELGVYGMGVVSSLTVQNSKGVLCTYPLTRGAVFQQIDALFRDFKIDAVKTGMLLKTEVVEEVYKALENKNVKIVVDPVLVSSSGKPLLEEKAISVLKEKLFSICSILTPNLPELEVLTGIEIKGEDDIEKAGKYLIDFGVDTVVVKGGHLKKGKTVIDYIFYEGKLEKLEYPMVNVDDVHGTGCVLSSAITAYLSFGYEHYKAIRLARAFLQYKLESVKKLGTGSFYFIL